MPDILFRPGDAITLKARARGSISPHGTGRIIAVQPVAQSSVTYRARLDHESFDRSISQDDIDLSNTLAGAAQDHPDDTMPARGSSWINSQSIKTKKPR